jgi:dTDP-4-amino-4,6-dideoxygalactose transaminase
LKEKLALFGGRPIRKKPFPPYPIITKDEINAVTNVIKSGELSTFHSSFLGGKGVREFEENFAKYHDTKFAIALNSGTAALHASIAAANIGPGDEVIVPPYTFTATATSILMHNAIPIFVDIDPKTYNLDPKKIEEKITSRTKAIIPVHLLGNPAEMDSIIHIANKNNLIVIEDCAQAPGALYKKQFVGTMGHLGIFSFQETKNLMTGEGGMIITNDSNLAERCHMIRNHGEAVVFGKPRSYISNILGWNYRMTEIEAAIGIEQLKKLDEGNDIRIRNSKFLIKGLSKIDFLNTQKVLPNVKHVYHIFGMTLDEEKIGINRNKFIEAVNAEGVTLSGGYPRPLYENPLFKEKIVYGNKGCPFSCHLYNGNVEYKTGMCPEAEKLCKNAVWTNLIRPPANLEDMQDIVDAIKKIVNNAGQLNG